MNIKGLKKLGGEIMIFGAFSTFFIGGITTLVFTVIITLMLFGFIEVSWINIFLFLMLLPYLLVLGLLLLLWFVGWLSILGESKHEINNSPCASCYHSKPFGQETWEKKPEDIGYECTIGFVPPEYGECSRWEPGG